MMARIVAGADRPAPATPRPARQGWRHGGTWRFLRRLSPLCWLGPSLLLIALVIVYPAIEMIRTSLLKVNSIGLSQGSNGLANYKLLFSEPALGHVVANTVLWVALVVSATILISMALAQYLNKRFTGRRIVRWALIVPWAASLVITSTVWRYIYEGSYGILNRVLLDLGIIHTPIEWYKDDATAFWCLIVVGVIVSLPFSTYVLLAGMQAIPRDLYEAALVDGAVPSQIYRRVTLPLLKPALLVSLVLNTIYVFNSFPIIWVITGKIPGDTTDTTITFMYKIAFTYRLNVGEAAALSVLNVAFLIIVVGFYLRRVRWTETGETAVVTGAAATGTGRAAVIRRLRGALRHRASALLAAGAGRAASGARTATAPVSGTVLAAGRVAGRAWAAVRPVGLPAVGLVVSAFFLAPYAVMFLSAMKSTHDLFHSPALYLPTKWEWGNFASVWSQIPLAAYLINSLIIAGVATAIVLAVSLPAAYFTARHNFRGRRAFLYAVLVTQMFAPVALVIGIYREFDVVDSFLQNHGAPLGALNTYWSIIAVNAAFNLAFSIWILNGYLASIPKEIEDAAMVDGAGRIRAMTRIVLPLAKPGIVTAVIFTFIQVWNEFVVAETIFNDPTRNRETLTVGINAFVGLYQTQYQYLFVASIIGIVPVVVLFAVIERYLVSGLTAGSIR
jgi:multiple sugar transport system permease protein